MTCGSSSPARHLRTPFSFFAAPPLRLLVYSFLSVCASWCLRPHVGVESVSEVSRAQGVGEQGAGPKGPQQIKGHEFAGLAAANSSGSRHLLQSGLREQFSFFMFRKIKFFILLSDFVYPFPRLTVLSYRGSQFYSPPRGI